MDTIIDSWNTRYRLQDRRAKDGLDDLARGSVLAAMGAALHREFGEEPTVYLVREVNCQCVVHRRDPSKANDDLAKQWGEYLAAALILTIRQDVGNGNVVCYPDLATHVVAFVEEILAGRPGEEWTFATFASHRKSTSRETLRSVLAAYPNEFLRITVSLYANGTLLKLLHSLDRTTVAELWATRTTENQMVASERDRPLFATALKILDRLGVVVDREQVEVWFGEYGRTHSATADWGEPQSLADQVVAVCRFLKVRCGLPTLVPEDEIEAATDDLDWLDVPRLREQLNDLFSGDGRWQGHQRRSNRITPKQQEFLKALLPILWQHRSQLDSSQLDCPGNQVLVFSAIVTKYPRWAEESVTVHLIQLTLRAAEIIRASDAPAIVLHVLDQEEFTELANRLTSVECEFLRSVSRFGPQLIACLWTLLDLSFPPRRQDVTAERTDARLPDENFIPQEEPHLSEQPITSVQGPQLDGRGPEDHSSSIHEPSPEVGPSSAQGRMSETSGQTEGKNAPNTGSQVDLNQPHLVSSMDTNSPDVQRVEPSETGSEEPVPAANSEEHRDLPVDQPGDDQVQELGQEFGAAIAGVAGVVTLAAGVFLLLRAVSDLRLPALVHQCEYPKEGHAFVRVLAALAARWAGLPTNHRLDPGIAWLTGEDHATVQSWFTQPAVDDEQGALRFQQSLAEIAWGRGLVDENAALRIAVASCAGKPLLLGGDETSGTWPFVAPLDQVTDTVSLVARWREVWERITKKPPTLIVPKSFPNAYPEGSLLEYREDNPPNLTVLLESLEVGIVGVPWFDSTMTAAAPILLRAWAGWLKVLSDSSVPYLLGQFIRRSGRILPQEKGLLVELEPRPLDVVLQMSGYLEPIEFFTRFPIRRVQFQLQRSP
ncbi:MAG: hypothetical protein ACFCD0_11815 [Gemmataceae bacterium]